ncbi:hypothetical protein MXE38_07650 [Anaerobiospirillum sp. NML120448]|uniref:hypothetical protein n=1 Tax=Anaerobiospirillum sp. NML120448 TaxID=2932816 RepID=UPI001FF6B160|nr:hypothetical protein [Anaerobiospirillum sp. NML120448]MCK0514715.1 hypothetical protein [Anaerobiospirillum sp. NML120448]
MIILENPFYLLGASLADDRRTIMSKVQDASLLGDPDECTKAGSLLTNHKNRVKCEVFYLPDLSQTEIKTKIEQLQSDPNNLLINILSEKIYDLSSGNLIASALLSSKYKPSLDTNKYAIKALSNVLETQDSEDVFDLINEMRLQSGFSQLADISLVSDALNDLKAYYLQAIKDLFKRLSFDDINSIMSELALKETTVNTNCSDFISSIVDYYEVLAQPHLKDAEQDVKDLIALFNDLFKYKYILRQEEFDLPDFKETSRFFNNIALFTIKTSDNAISWASKEVSNKLSSWIDIALPILIVNKSNGLFYKPCDALVLYCLNYLTEMLYTYQTKIALINIKTIFVYMVEVFGKPLYVETYRTKNIQQGISTIDNMLRYVDDYDYSLANFSISKTTGLIFKQVLTINFDYLQFQSSKYSWNEHFDFDKTMLLNSMESLALLNAATKGKSKKIVNSELWEISLAITFSKAAMVLAKDLMCGKKINLTSQNDEQLTFCDSGLIVDGHHCSWSDVNIKVDDSTLFFKTDLDCYTIDHNSFASFLQYILHTTFQALQKKESLNNQISLSEKLFMFAQLTEWGLAQNVVQKHNGGVFSFPVQVK